MCHSRLRWRLLSHAKSAFVCLLLHSVHTMRHGGPPRRSLFAPAAASSPAKPARPLVAAPVANPDTRGLGAPPASPLPPDATEERRPRLDLALRPALEDDVDDLIASPTLAPLAADNRLPVALASATPPASVSRVTKAAPPACLAEARGSLEGSAIVPPQVVPDVTAAAVQGMKPVAQTAAHPSDAPRPIPVPVVSSTPPGAVEESVGILDSWALDSALLSLRHAIFVEYDTSARAASASSIRSRPALQISLAVVFVTIDASWLLGRCAAPLTVGGAGSRATSKTSVDSALEAAFASNGVTWHCLCDRAAEIVAGRLDAWSDSAPAGVTPSQHHAPPPPSPPVRVHVSAAAIPDVEKRMQGICASVARQCASLPSPSTRCPLTITVLIADAVAGVRPDVRRRALQAVVNGVVEASASTSPHLSIAASACAIVGLAELEAHVVDGDAARKRPRSQVESHGLAAFSAVPFCEHARWTQQAQATLRSMGAGKAGETGGEAIDRMVAMQRVCASGLQRAMGTAADAVQQSVVDGGAAYPASISLTPGAGGKLITRGIGAGGASQVGVPPLAITFHTVAAAVVAFRPAIS